MMILSIGMPRAGSGWYYNLTNDLKAPLLGLPAESDFVLLNVYNDKTFMNDFLAHELYEKMGH